MIEAEKKLQTRVAPRKRWRNMWKVRSEYVCALTGRLFRPGYIYLTPPCYPSAEIAEQRARDEMREPQFPPHLSVLDDVYLGPVAVGEDYSA